MLQLENLKNLISEPDGSLSLKRCAFTAALGLSVFYTLKELISFFIGQRFKYPEMVDQSKFKSSNFLEYLKQNHVECLKELLENYPDECCLSLDPGFLKKSKKVIILNSTSAVKKFSHSLDNSQAISNRPKNFLMRLISRNYLGSFFRMNDESLLHARKSTLAGLHKLIGDGVQLELNLAQEISQLVKFLSDTIQNSDERNESAVLDNAYIHLQQYSTNVIASIGLGLRFEYELDANTAVKNQINNISDLFSSLNIFEIEQFGYADQFFNKETFKFVSERVDSIYGFLKGAISDYKAKYDPNVLKTFADFAIGQHIDLSKNDKLKPKDCYSEEDILVQVFTLIMAGADTVGFTLAWSFYYLSKHPNVQERIYKEIVATVGSGETVKYSQRAHMTYTCACINEILRLGSSQSLIPRAVLKNAHIAEYRLPANTTVLINSFAIDRDRKHWSSPDEFDPERWLGDDGKLISKPEGFIAFGTSPRSCLGETLARNVVFLAVTNLVLNFELDYVPVGGQDENGILGVMRRPSKYNMKITRRK